MSKALFSIVMTGYIALGIVASMGLSQLTKGYEFASNSQVVTTAIAVFFVSMGGAAIAIRSHRPGFSLLGYVLVAGPFGLFLGPVFAKYPDASIVRAFIASTLIVILFGVVGAVIPEDFSKLVSALSIIILVALVGYLIAPIASTFGIDVGGPLHIMDWILIIVFALMTTVDWNRAIGRGVFTHDAAIDSALAVYLDWLNIFIRILGFNPPASS